MRIELPLPPLKNYRNLQIYCPENAAKWDSLTWGRFNGGGKVDARHLFVDDWRLGALWRRPGESYLKVGPVCTAPDFTVESWYPSELVHWQYWRSVALAQYWQDCGVVVVPVLQWGHPDSFAAKYIKHGSVVAVRGPCRSRADYYGWIKGARWMQDQIKPSLVLHFGNKITSVWENAIFYPLNPQKSKKFPQVGLEQSTTV